MEDESSSMTQKGGASTLPRFSSFPKAYVRILSSTSGKPTKTTCAWCAISSKIHWKEVQDGEQGPRSLLDFRHGNALEITRLAKDATWDAVLKQVLPHDEGKAYSLVVHGKIHGPERLTRVNSNVKLILTASSKEERNRWMEWARVRVAPWELLHRRVKDLAASFDITSTNEELRKEVQAMIDNDGKGGALQKLTGLEMPLGSNSQFGFSVRVAGFKLKIKSKLVDKSGEPSKKSASVSEKKTKESAEDKHVLVRGASRLASIARHAGRGAKNVPGVGSVFQLLELSARQTTLVVEANLSCPRLPGIIAEIVGYLQLVLESSIQMLHSNASPDEILRGNVFQVLQSTLDILGDVESLLLRGNGSQALGDEVIQELELNVSRLEKMTENVAHSAAIVKRDAESNNSSRPQLSPYFVGRINELNRLKSILFKYGTAVITQFGGIGKTQLIVAFARFVELENLAPAGIYWVNAAGGMDELMHSLATLAESLLSERMSQVDRKDMNMVVAALYRGLSRGKKRWLLCLDNAGSSDDRGVVEVLDAVFSLANPRKGNGWVMVASQAGNTIFWDHLEREQELVLHPLTDEDSMCLLWRIVYSTDSIEKDDITVNAEVNRIKELNPLEYNSLKKLSGFLRSHSFRGIPLALFLAGMYIRRFECSFTEYLDRCKEADKRDDELVLPDSSDEHAPERSVMRIALSLSIGRLSSNALNVFRALSMFGEPPIPKVLLRGILEKIPIGSKSLDWKCLNLVVGELVQDSGLVNVEKSNGSDVLIIHPNVRQFVIAEMEFGSMEWDSSLTRALFAVFGTIQELLESEGRSFENLPNVYGPYHDMYVPHALAILDNFNTTTSFDDKVSDLGMLYKLHQYTGAALQFFGQLNRGREVGERLLRMVYQRDGDDAKNEEVAAAIENLGSLYEAQGNWDEAASAYSRCVDVKRAIYGHDANRHEIAVTLNSLGNVYKEQGKAEDASWVLHQCLEIEYSIHGRVANNPAIATALNSLSAVYQVQGKLDEAISMQRQCLDMNRAIYGLESAHPTIASNFGTLGNLYLLLGDHAVSASMLRQCLQMNYVIRGRDVAARDVANALSQLGTAYFRQGKQNLAASMHSKCLKMKRALYGNNSCLETTASTLAHLGKVYYLQGKLRAAASMHRQSLYMNREIHGHNSHHPAVGMALSNLGSVLKEQMKLKEAMVMFVASRAVFHEAFGEDSEHQLIRITEENIEKVKEAMVEMKEQNDRLMAAAVGAAATILVLQVLKIFSRT